MQFSELWQAVRVQLQTAKMARMLGPGKVYIEGEDYNKPEGTNTGPWGRLVIVPAASLWDTPDYGPLRDIAFLTRAEMSDFKALDSGTGRPFNPHVPLDAIQEECESRLNGWLPVGLARIKPALPIYLYSSTQPNAMWDDDRTLYWTSAQYRLDVAK